MACSQGSLQIARVAPLAFSSEEIRTAGAHGDPGEGHHRDPWRAGNKADPSTALSSPAFLPPPALTLTFNTAPSPSRSPRPPKFRPRVLSSRPTSASSCSAPPSPHPPVKPVLLVIKTSRWPAVIPLTNGGGTLGGKLQMRVYRHGPSINNG